VILLLERGKIDFSRAISSSSPWTVRAWRPARRRRVRSLQRDGVAGGSEAPRQPIRISRPSPLKPYPLPFLSLSLFSLVVWRHVEEWGRRRRGGEEQTVEGRSGSGERREEWTRGTSSKWRRASRRPDESRSVREGGRGGG
jgi:hypothetical protein